MLGLFSYFEIPRCYECLLSVHTCQYGRASQSTENADLSTSGRFELSTHAKQSPKTAAKVESALDRGGMLI